MDGHDPLRAATARAARLKLTELPDAVLLDSIETQAETITLLRDLRAGAIAGADSRVPVLALSDSPEADHIRYYNRSTTTDLW